MRVYWTSFDISCWLNFSIDLTMKLLLIATWLEFHKAPPPLELIISTFLFLLFNTGNQLFALCCMCKITHRHEIYSVKLVDGERFIHLFIFNENCRNLWWKILSLHLLLQLNKISRRYSSLLPIIFVRGIIEINLRVERKGLSASRRECALECSWLYAIIMQYSCIFFSLCLIYIFFFLWNNSDAKMRLFDKSVKIFG